MPLGWSITFPVYHRHHLLLLMEKPLSLGVCIFDWRLLLVPRIPLCKMSDKLYFLSRVATVLLQGMWLREQSHVQAPRSPLPNPAWKPGVDFCCSRQTLRCPPMISASWY